MCGQNTRDPCGFELAHQESESNSLPTELCDACMRMRTSATHRARRGEKNLHVCILTQSTLRFYTGSKRRYFSLFMPWEAIFFAFLRFLCFALAKFPLVYQMPSGQGRTCALCGQLSYEFDYVSEVEWRRDQQLRRLPPILRKGAEEKLRGKVRPIACTAHFAPVPERPRVIATRVLDLSRILGASAVSLREFREQNN